MITVDANEGRIILSILRLLRNDHDHLAWRSLLMLRKNQLGAGITQQIIDISLAEQVPFAEILQHIREDNDKLPRHGSRVAEEYSHILDFVSQLAEDFDLESLDSNSLGALIDRVIDFSIESQDAGKQARDFLIRRFESAEAETLYGFLPTIEAASETIEQDLDPDTVNMLTMHKAKGLSASAVIVMAAEDETIPGRQEDEPGLGDERRLLFVSLTRAKHKLFVTYCNERVGQQAMLGRISGRQRRTLTRFLRHAPIRPIVGAEFVEAICAEHP